MIDCCMWTAALRRDHQPAKKMLQRHVGLLNTLGLCCRSTNLRTQLWRKTVS